MLKQFLIFTLVFVNITLFSTSVFAQQPAWTFNLLDTQKRSQQFSERKLGSEKMADKKFTPIRHLFQNNYTHFNYYYNANNKINLVLERAKLAQRDNYTKLLSYYPYSLENTLSQKRELDSVILKATAGILLHDLRNDWIDNMYLLMGEAYFFRKDFDSAAAVFQFINYNLFPRAKHEEDNRIVGTTSASDKGKISIANKEKRNIIQKIATQPPSRNDALIWMARTLIEQDELAEAAGLINTLQEDPNLPARLKDDLDEVNGYWFYKQGIYDSAASHLERALTHAVTKEDKARSEYLLGQLFELNHQYAKANVYYDKASEHTVNPLMNIYALMNNAKMVKNNNSKELDESINNLVHMSKKDKFDTYRDILFYSAGELAMQKPDTTEAITFFNKSLRNNENNAVFKNKALFQLADIAYNRKHYRDAFNYYDSLQSGDTTIKDKLAQIQARRNVLSKIAERITNIEREDSLQMIAAMSQVDRDAFIKKMVKKYRHDQGLNDVDNNSGSTAISFDSNKPSTDIFGASNNTKGEWYFYNASLKSKGYNEFRRTWGNRENTDNWRVKNSSAAGNTANTTANPGNMSPDADIDAVPDAGKKDAGNTKDGAKDGSKDPAGKTDITKSDNGKTDAGNKGNQKGKIAAGANATAKQDISYDGLLANVPLTAEKIKKSSSIIATSLYELAKIYQNDLEDYPEAIATYQKSLQRFPDSLYDGEIYLGLYYCYTKTGDATNAALYKQLLLTKFAHSHAANILTNPLANNPNAKNPEGTKRYEAIYNLFIEGKFEEAVIEKKKADSLYGSNYWTPQLLYIEAVYQIKQRDDSDAIKTLSNIVKLYPASPLKPKSERLIDVLKRRAEIEAHLMGVNIVTPKNDSSNLKPANLNPIAKKDIKRDSIPVTLLDTTNAAKTALNQYDNGDQFTFNEKAPQSVIMVLDKVDATFINEAKNAMNRYVTENFQEISLNIEKEVFDKDHTFLVFSLFLNSKDALQFLAKVRKAAPNELSWLTPNKYSFLIISDYNMQVLKENKDLSGYKILAGRQYPGAF